MYKRITSEMIIAKNIVDVKHYVLLDFPVMQMNELELPRRDKRMCKRNYTKVYIKAMSS